MINKVKKLMRAFEPDHEIRIVGGFVRDKLMGIKPKDIDLATTALPYEIVDRCEKQGWAVIPTGIDHGTVTVVVNEHSFEVTTLRIDRETDGRHAKVEFTNSFEEDAARRDFTMNAMSMDAYGNIYDYFGGQSDIKNRVIRFVGTPTRRIEEDYLRILRYFRFASTYGMNCDITDLVAIHSRTDGLYGISVERIWQEMQKLLVGPYCVPVCAFMDQIRIFNRIHIELKPDALENLPFAPDAISALSTLVLHPEDVVWKLSNEERKKLTFLCEVGRVRKPEVPSIYFEDFLVDGIPKDWVLAAIRTYYYNFLKLYRYIEHWNIPVFPVRGQDLVDFGYVPGPDIGRMMADMKKMWKESRFILTKDELLCKA